eukprot:9971176-Lingulodinium_polyedra.AAC.1
MGSCGAELAAGQLRRGRNARAWPAQSTPGAPAPVRRRYCGKRPDWGRVFGDPRGGHRLLRRGRFSWRDRCE